MRWLVLATGAVLVGIAFVAGSRVEDTREGLIAEVIALFAGLSGVGMVMYGLVGPAARAHAHTPAPKIDHSPPVQIRSANDLLIGAGGLAIAAILIAGIGLNSGALWALMGMVLLLPMVIGCAYLCIRFFRAPEREWKIDLPRLTRHR